MKLRHAVQLSRFPIVLLFLGFVGTGLTPAQNRAEPPPPPGMGIGPPPMGEWYKPPYFENRSNPPRAVFEFAPNSKEKRLLAVADEHLQGYAGFLRGRDTGAFRLLTYIPRGRVVSANSPDIEWRKGFSEYASEYSFVKKKHGHGVNGWGDERLGWAELRLRKGLFSTGFMQQSLALLVQLGDVPLEDVTTETAGVAELTQLVAPADYATALALSKKLFTGYRANGFAYAAGMFARVNTTYVLRSVMNKKVDHVVAFRVVAQDEEGVSIVWKRLVDYPKPKWKVPKAAKVK
jgi:hypothetical protein